MKKNPFIKIVAFALAAVAAVERKYINIRARSMDLLHAGPNKMWNEFVAEAAEEMCVHKWLSCPGLLRLLPDELCRKRRAW